MKPSILHFRLIQSEIEKYKKENGIDDASRAFLEFCIEKKLELDRDEIVDSIIDGSNDRGIDAIYINDDTESRPVVYLFQSKYYRSEDKFDRTLEGAALEKMQSAIENLILKSTKEVHAGNEFLMSKLRDIKSLSNPRFQIIFCSNSMPPNSQAKSRFDDFIKEKSQAQDFFRVEYMNLSELCELITPVTSRTINAKLKLTGTYFDWSHGEARVIAGRLSGKTLAELRKEYGSELFDRNVRGYLSKKNPVNKEIYSSATDPTDASRFFFLNNGITIVCNNVSYLPVEESPEIEITNLQIVNGGQTTNSIFEALQDNKLADSLYVLARIVATQNSDLIEKITESTNTQTNVRARDLHSNDLVQKTVERLLRNQGYYYETRKNKYKASPLARGKRIDMEAAAQAYYAFNRKKPADAKNKKRDLFGPLYDEIFNESDMQLADGLLLSYKTLEWVRRLHPNYREKYNFVKYAELHSIALLSFGGIKTLVELDKVPAKNLYESILAAMAEIVRDDSKRLGEQYSHRILFINPETLGRIREKLKGSSAH
jgi:hypothetical protein